MATTTTVNNSNKNLTEIPAEWFEVHFQNTDGDTMMVFTEHSEARLRERFIDTQREDHPWVWFITRCSMEFTGCQYRIASNLLDGGTALPEIGRMS
jgi:hypothetical protein